MAMTNELTASASVSVEDQGGCSSRRQHLHWWRRTILLRRKCCSCRTVCVKRFRGAEVLILTMACELPDGNMLTIGAVHLRALSRPCMRTRTPMSWCQAATSSLSRWKCCSSQAFSQRIPRHLVPEQPGMRRVHPQVCVRQCRVLKRHEYDPEGYERTTKERAASTPSAMKIKAVVPTSRHHLHCRR